MMTILGRKMRSKKCRRKRCAVILLFNAIFVFIIFISAYQHTHRLQRLKDLQGNKTALLKKQAEDWLADMQSTQENPLFNEKRRLGEVTVLFWTPYFGRDHQEDPTWLAINQTYPACFQRCRVVRDRSYFAISDAVVFHSRDMRKDDLPIVHPSEQLWIYMQQESPSYTKENLSEYENVFNLTMTYRQDSDIYHPYFVILPVAVSSFDLHRFKEDVLPRKTKLVAWIVSNCYTRGQREAFVSNMFSRTPVDIYGRCGDYSCHHRGEDGCLPEIATQYKFYLAFENSLCTDYITEKFSRALQYNIVPIVYGGANYDSLAPPGSYINARDFSSVVALADYLQLLDRSPDLYLQYFEWKTRFKVQPGHGWCSLCRLLQKRQRSHSSPHPNKELSSSSYGNLEEWWHNRKGNQTRPLCYDPAPEGTTGWSLFRMVGAGFRYVRRWFYKGILGY